MDKRLSKIYELIPYGKGIIDVGTDHAYLPVELALNGYPGIIIASDINEGPLNTARATAERYHVTDRIRFTLCPGLDQCSPEDVDTIVIAGMGGDMICHILDHAEWCMAENYTLILQPMTKPEVLRYWLFNNGFLVKDYMVHEGRFYYQIMTAVYTGENTSCSEAELYTGRFEYIRDYDFAEEFLTKELDRNQKELTGLSRSTSVTPERLELYRDMISRLEEMRRMLHD